MGKQSLLFGLQGRITRAPWWIGNIGITIITILIAFFAMATSPYLLVVILIFVYAGFALSLKRAHDRDRPDWYVIVPYLLSLLSSVARFTMISSAPEATPGTSELLLFAVDIVVSIWGLVLLIDLGFLRGTRGPNRYGPDPLET
ncbi:DUF805 domain-containing protein [Terrihabitans soli]|uniref:DUF805 domain-containing protein n=1 Tax=Terrihabitans soli TaxID=708113 RepID=A0A6S6QXJ9_9HYPH|nr:DUF805 domain-containing protein [Terrihabitans soli]BCJ92002.1 DUF805 domain-containing protein [Terrihabitans soli]